MTDELPPHDPDAERALLGAMLLDPQAIVDTEQLGLGDFYLPAHTAIATAIHTRHSLGRPVDPILIAQDLHRTTAVRNIPGGAGPYLHTCIQACPAPSHAPHYIRIVVGHATARRLLALSEDLIKAAHVDDPDQRTTLLATAQQALTRATSATKPAGHHIRLTPASAFPIKAVRWVWDARMPLGEITLIPGREGVGKSTFLAWLAAAITNGNLPGIHHGHPKAVLYAASEDAWSYTIAPRMLAAGANLDLVYRIDVEAEDGTGTGLILPRDCRHIPDVAAQVDAAALMCDPLVSLIDDNISGFKAQELRRALEPLRRAAEQAQIAVPGLVHFNKSSGTDVNSAIAGARAWVEVARAVIAIAQDKEADDYTCVVSQTKNNLGRSDLPNLMYTIDSVTLETDDDVPAHVGRLRWTGETDVTAEDLLSGSPDDRGLSDNTISIIEWVESGERPVSVQEVADQFEGRIKYDTVKKTLARCAKRGDLVSPGHGQYMSVKAGKSRKKGHSSTPPTTPPVPVSPVSLSQVRSSRGVSPRETPGTRSRERDTRDTRDTVDAPERARTRDSPPTQPPSSPPEPQVQLTACAICYRPIENDDGTGLCDRCEPEPEERERYP